MNYLKTAIKTLPILFILPFISFSHSNKRNQKTEELTVEMRDTSILEQYIADFDSYLSKQLDTLSNAGAALVIVQKDSVLLIKPYGVKKYGTTDSVDLHTVFRLASVSKGFSGVLAALLHADSIIDYHENVKSILKGFNLQDSSNTNELTIEHLLSHTSGLIPHAYDNLLESDIPLVEIMSQLKDVQIVAKPGKLYGYQNSLFSLIDPIFEIKTEKPFDSLLHERIFSPLGMKDASASFEDFVSSDNYALPHKRGKGRSQLLNMNKRYYNAIPAAGVNASISDMAIWLKALLGSNPDILSEQVIEDVCQPVIETPLLHMSYTRYWPELKEKSYGLGWRIYNLEGNEIVYHGGYVHGYKAEIAFCREHQVGIAFLQNSPNRVSAQSIPRFFKGYFGLNEHKN